MTDKYSERALWRDHENRITELEVTLRGISDKIDAVENVVIQGQDNQQKLFDQMTKRMVDEFFNKKKADHKNSWKLILGITGGVFSAGGLLSIIINSFL